MKDVRKLDFILSIVLVIFLLAAAGCVPQPLSQPPQGAGPSPAEPTPTPPGAVLTSQPGLTSLIDKLRQSGAEVEPAEEIEGHFFPVPGQVIMVNGQRVEVYEFRSEEARLNTSRTISDSGFTVGNAMIEWIDQPNFWASGNLIVLYVGTDGNLIDTLSQHLGDPITRPIQPQPNHPAAVLAAVDHLKASTGAAVENIEVLGFEYVQWPNACLGVENPQMMCAEVITPGYRVVLGLDGDTYTYHTDESGNQVLKLR